MPETWICRVLKKSLRIGNASELRLQMVAKLNDNACQCVSIWSNRLRSKASKWVSKFIRRRRWVIKEMVSLQSYSFEIVS